MGMVQAKQDQAGLKAQLLGGDMLIDDAEVCLVMPSFEGTYGEPYIYKTPHHPDCKRDRHVKTAHAALHTAAAPTIYAGVKNDSQMMVDGAPGPITQSWWPWSMRWPATMCRPINSAS